MKKLFIFFFILINLTVIQVFCQASEALTQLITTDNVTVGQTAYFAGCSLNLIEDTCSYQEATKILINYHKNLSKMKYTDPIDVKYFSLICMKTWNIKGGIFYSLFHSPLYAFKELQAKGFIASNIDPDQNVSGSLALELMTKCIELSEKRTN